jgi:hypothetical protein
MSSHSDSDCSSDGGITATRVMSTASPEAPNHMHMRDDIDSSSPAEIAIQVQAMGLQGANREEPVVLVVTTSSIAAKADTASLRIGGTKRPLSGPGARIHKGETPLGFDWKCINGKQVLIYDGVTCFIGDSATSRHISKKRKLE